MNLAVSKLGEILRDCQDFIAGMVQLGYEPSGKKTLQRLFTPGEAAEMVGRDRTTLARAEAHLGLADQQRNPATQRRVGYTLEQIQRFRAHFDTLPWRDPNTDEAALIGVANFKGGTGKSTTCIHVAHGLATKGYRGLVVDADHQGTLTSMFGYVPDRDLKEEHTLLPYLLGEQNDLNYAIRKTHWPNLDLIPACMALSDAEIAIVLHLAGMPEASRAGFFQELRIGLQSVIHNYDFVLIDSPPSNGMIALQVMMAVDALMVPTAPKMYDFASTAQYLAMIRHYISQVDPTKEYRWIRVLNTMFDKRYKSHWEFVTTMKQLMPGIPFARVFSHDRHIMNGAAKFVTPYEERRPKREVMQMLDSVCNEVEEVIWAEWPSKRDQLIARGIAA